MEMATAMMNLNARFEFPFNVDVGVCQAVL